MAHSFVYEIHVHTISHEDYVINWRKTLRYRSIWLKERSESIRFLAWESRSQQFHRKSKYPPVSDLIPGLQDDLVELQIWTCKKWRFLLHCSKSWAAMRLIKYELMLDLFQGTEYAPSSFHQTMMNLPPIDIFSRERIERLELWFKIWFDMSKEDRNIMLELYPARTDRLRLENWVEERDHWNDGSALPDQRQFRCIP